MATALSLRKNILVLLASLTPLLCTAFIGTAAPPAPAAYAPRPKAYTLSLIHI